MFFAHVHVFERLNDPLSQLENTENGNSSYLPITNQVQVILLESVHPHHSPPAQPPAAPMKGQRTLPGFSPSCGGSCQAVHPQTAFQWQSRRQRSRGAVLCCFLQSFSHQWLLPWHNYPVSITGPKTKLKRINQ